VQGQKRSGSTIGLLEEQVTNDLTAGRLLAIVSSVCTLGVKPSWVLCGLGSCPTIWGSYEKVTIDLGAGDMLPIFSRVCDLAVKPDWLLCGTEGR
jgi:hypothetical protein